MTYGKKDIPKLAFGTFPLKGDAAYNAVKMALEVGYRHLDTAQMYQNEIDLGKAIKTSGLAMDKIFLTTKILPLNYSEDRFIDSLKKSCEDLQVDRVDMLLLHWPPINQPLEPILDLLEYSLELGLSDRIGISNFTSYQIELACKYLRHAIAVNQVEFHAYLDQSKIIKKASSLKIQLMAYCSLARGQVISDPIIRNIAEHHSVNAGAVALNWIIQQGVIPTVLSTNRARALCNIESLKLKLNAEEIKQITKLTQKNIRLVSPSGLSPKWDE